MSALLAPIQSVGALVVGFFRVLAEVFSLLYGACVVPLYVRTRGFRLIFAVIREQIRFTGVHGLPIVTVASLALGTLIITQANAYLPAEYASTVAARIVVRDVIPLVVAIIIIGRSGTAICVELGGMKLSGEIDALRSMGLPLEQVIVLPRLVAVVVSTVCLTVYGMVVGIALSYYLSRTIGSLPFALDALVNASQAQDLVAAILKALLFGGGITLVSIREAFTVRISHREVPRANTRAVVRSMGLVVVLNSALSIFL